MDLRKALGIVDYSAEENTASFEVYPEPGSLTGDELAAVRAQLLDHLLPFLAGYIWQRDRFSLQLSTQQLPHWHRRTAAARSERRQGSAEATPLSRGEAAEAAPPFLWGSLGFGDNVEDEWFAVWLLLELTRAFPVTARVWDNDGEFLLIEAAYGLPRWLKPETAANRVWLHAGAFHLVPPPRFKGDPLLSPTPSLAQALAAVRGGEVPTLAPPAMQSPLLDRLEGYPQRAKHSMHVAHALVPARVAHLLRGEPQLLAAAAEAFHYRDPDDARAASRMSAFPPRDMVLAAPTFSRCLYAQLALQEYAPPRGYPLPLPSEPGYRAALLGLKLTAGFEMVLANRARYGWQEEGEEGQGEGEGQQAAGQSGAANLAGHPGWAAFVGRLQAAGYFRGSLPGSQQHTRLLEAAAASYSGAEAYRRAAAALAAPAVRAEQLLEQAIDPASFPPPDQLPAEGSEDWLAAQAGQQLEAELARRQAELQAGMGRPQRGGTHPDGGADEAGGEYDPSELAGRLRAFVDMAAGLEGAEVPQPGAEAQPASGLALDEAAFAAELRRVLGLGAAAARRQGLGGDDDGDDSSDEGSSFFSGSEASEDGEEEEEGEQAHRKAPSSGGQLRQAPPRAAAPRGTAPERGCRPGGSEGGSEGWEADTATDSDDDAAFMHAYSGAMDAQLAGTRMAHSFQRAAGSGEAAHGQAGQEEGAPGQAGRGAGPGEEKPAPSSLQLRPLDLDVNLVSSLLASYGEQAGLPGPAGSLAGLLGVELPPPQPPSQR